MIHPTVGIMALTLSNLAVKAAGLGDYYILNAIYKYPGDSICSEMIGYEAYQIDSCRKPSGSSSSKSFYQTCKPIDAEDPMRGYHMYQYNFNDANCKDSQYNSSSLYQYPTIGCIAKVDSHGHEVHWQQSCWDATTSTDKASPWKKYVDNVVILYHNKEDNEEAHDCDSEIYKFDGFTSSACMSVTDVDYGPCTGSYIATCTLEDGVHQQYYSSCDCSGPMTRKEVDLGVCDSSHYTATEFGCTY